MSDLTEAAAKALTCLDLTNLNDDCDAGAIRELCARAQTVHGPTAAVCIWPDFVSQAKTLLSDTRLKIATVVSFPEGDHDIGDVVDLTQKAVADGADEIDLVVPYKSLMEGHPENIPARVSRVKEATGRAKLKAILETGILETPDLIRQAAELAIHGGADFIKTSTGKVPVNATLPAARIMLEVIRDADDPVGLKPAGGVRTTEDAKAYLDLCAEIMGPDWASPETFRIGASGVLDALIATLDGREADVSGSAY